MTISPKRRRKLDQTCRQTKTGATDVVALDDAVVKIEINALGSVTVTVKDAEHYISWLGAARARAVNGRVSSDARALTLTFIAE